MIRALLKTAVVVTLAVPTMAAAQFVDSQPYQIESKYPYQVYPSSYQMDNNYPWETQTYPFNSNGTYTQTQQQTILQNETSLSGGTLSGQDLAINQGSIPEASQTNVPAPVEHLPDSDEVQTSGSTYNKAYSKAQFFGNSMFGAGYDLNASITSTDSTMTQAKRVDAFAEGKVYATAFNNQKEIVRGRAEVHGQEGGSNTGTAALFAMGQQIWSTNLNYTFSFTPINWSRPFFTVSKYFMVGPVPINVTASMAGGVKLTISGEIAPTVAKLNAVPGGWANVNASASVSIVVASFGVQGGLTVINVTLPTYGELFWPLCTINWKLKTDLTLNTLSGYLDLFAKINFIFFSKTWTLNIARWNGLNYNLNLVNLNGTKDLGICMFGSGDGEVSF